MSVSRETYCNCLFYSANALARRMTKMADEAFKPAGVAASPAFILMTVNRQPGVNAGELARVMQLSPSTVTRIVDRLENNGYVTRIVEGRCMQIFATRKTRMLETTLKECWKNLHTRYATILGEEEGKILSASLHDASRKLD